MRGDADSLFPVLRGEGGGEGRTALDERRAHAQPCFRIQRSMFDVGCSMFIALAGEVEHRTSNTEHLGASGRAGVASGSSPSLRDRRHRSIEHRTLNIEHRTSNTEYRMLNRQ